MQGTVLELVVFGLRPDVEVGEFVAVAGEVSNWLALQPGFVSRELFDVGDQRWIDTVRWVTMEQALAAAEVMMSSSECGRFMEMLDQSSVQMFHGVATAHSSLAQSPV